jgi:hypothetical protein
MSKDEACERLLTYCHLRAQVLRGGEKVDMGEPYGENVLRFIEDVFIVCTGPGWRLGTVRETDAQGVEFDMPTRMPFGGVYTETPGVMYRCANCGKQFGAPTDTKGLFCPRCRKTDNIHRQL